MRLLWRAALLIVAIVLIVFAVSNRATVAIGLWPLPDAVEAPLYLVMLAALLVGFVAGELAAWTAGRHWRREARREGRTIAVLERDLAEARAANAAVRTPDAAELRD